MGGRAAEFVVVDGDAGELGDHGGARHEGVRRFGHDHVVDDAEQQSGSRYGRTVDDDDGRNATRAIGECARGQTPGVQCRESVADLGTRRGDHGHEREQLIDGGARGRFDHARRLVRQGALVHLGRDIDPHHATVAE